MSASAAQADAKVSVDDSADAKTPKPMSNPAGSEADAVSAAVSSGSAAGADDEKDVDQRKVSKIPTVLWRTGTWPALFADAFLTDSDFEGAMSSRWALRTYASALREMLNDAQLSAFAGLSAEHSALRAHVAEIADGLDACAEASCSRERDEMLEEDEDRDSGQRRARRRRNGGEQHEGDGVWQQSTISYSSGAA